MSDLRGLFVDLGHEDVTTHIQSGNVIFRARSAKPAGVVGDIEGRIADDLGLDVTVLLRTPADLDRVIAGNPFSGRADPSKLHVTFLADVPGRSSAGAPEAPAGPDEFEITGREVYVHAPGGYGRSKLNNTFFEKRLGVPATTRNWNTVTKLSELASG